MEALVEIARSVSKARLYSASQLIGCIEVPFVEYIINNPNRKNWELVLPYKT